MELSVEEFGELNEVIQVSLRKAFKDGIESEKERVLPDNLFEALIEYGKKTGTLLNYHKSSGKSDGCNWVQIKPTRDGSEGITCVEISFEENLTEIHHIGIGIRD